MQGPEQTSINLIPFSSIQHQDLAVPISNLTMPQPGRLEKTSRGDNQELNLLIKLLERSYSRRL